MSQRIRTFYLDRIEDESGISGTGIVAEGMEFGEFGPCVLGWRTAGGSAAVYRSLQELEDIHSHGGKTQVRITHSYVINDDTAGCELPNDYYAFYDFLSKSATILTDQLAFVNFVSRNNWTLADDALVEEKEQVQQ